MKFKEDFTTRQKRGFFQIFMRKNIYNFKIAKKDIPKQISLLGIIF